MKDLNLPVYIIALNSGHSEDGELSIIHRALNLNREQIKPVIGCYKGELENSYVIPVNPVSLGSVLALAREYNQESILSLDSTRNAYLIPAQTINDEEYLGQFVSVPAIVAKQQDSYTYDPSTDTYYIVR